MSHLKRVQSFESLLKKKGFNSLSHFSRQDQSFLWVKIFVKQILWVMLKKWVQFCESCKKGFNSVSCIRKKGFNSVSYIQKINSWSHFYFFSKHSVSHFFFFAKKGSIQWVIIFEKFRILSIILKKVQFCGSYSRKRFNSLRHIEKKFNSSSQVEKENNSLLQNKKFHSLRLFFWHKVQFLWVILLEKVQFFETFLRKFGLNSLSHILEIRFNFFCQSKKKFNSLSHVGKQERFNSSRHIEKRGSLLWVKRRVQFCESFSLQEKFDWVILKKRFNSLSHIEKKKLNSEANKKKVQFFASHEKKVSILCVIFKEKGFNPLNQRKISSLRNIFFQKNIQFFESFLSKKSILWVIFEKKSSFPWVIWKKVQFWESYKKSSILWVISEKKQLNPLSRIGEFQFFESYSKKKNQCRKKVIFKKVQFSELYWKKISSVSRIRTKKFHFESHSEKKGSILWVIFFFWKNILFCLLFFQKKKGSSLWVLEKKSNSWSFGKKVFESC